MQCSQRAEKGVTFPRTDIIDSYGHHTCSKNQPLSGSESQCSEQLDYLSIPRFSLFCFCFVLHCFIFVCFVLCAFFLVPSRIMP